MENISVREVMPKPVVEPKVVVNEPTYRERNLGRNDAFIDIQIYSAEAAMDRLKLLRKIMKEWKTAFNNLDRRNMPADLVEMYEKIWALMRTVELDETDIIKIGD